MDGKASQLSHAKEVGVSWKPKSLQDTSMLWSHRCGGRKRYSPKMAHNGRWSACVGNEWLYAIRSFMQKCCGYSVGKKQPLLQTATANNRIHHVSRWHVFTLGDWFDLWIHFKSTGWMIASVVQRWSIPVHFEIILNQEKVSGKQKLDSTNLAIIAARKDLSHFDAMFVVFHVLILIQQLTGVHRSITKANQQIIELNQSNQNSRRWRKLHDNKEEEEEASSFWQTHTRMTLVES